MIKFELDFWVFPETLCINDVRPLNYINKLSFQQNRFKWYVSKMTVIVSLAKVMSVVKW